MTSPTTTISLHPGTAVGPYKLGDSLWRVLEELRAKGGEEGTCVRWDREDPCGTVIVDLQHGIQLVFPQTGPPYRQVLGCIFVRLDAPDTTNASKRSAGRTSVDYAGKHVVDIGTSSSGLTRSRVTQLFGPCFAPRTNAPRSVSARASPRREREIKYPGIIFHVDEETEDVVRGFTVVPMGVEGSEEVRKAVDKLRNDGRGEWGVWGDDVRGLEGTITHCEIHPGQGITLPFSYSPNTPSSGYKIAIGSTTAQDLLADLGPPARKYWKEDGRGVGSGTEGVGTDERSRGCWWNYFELGLDFLIDETPEGGVRKVMVHSNIPGTAEFQRYARCPWTISMPSGGKDLTLQSSLRDFASTFGTTDHTNGEGPVGRRKTAGDGVGVQATVQLDRLDAPHMAGLRDIEASQLLALEGMVVEGGKGGITSVLVF